MWTGRHEGRRARGLEATRAGALAGFALDVSRKRLVLGPLLQRAA